MLRTMQLGPLVFTGPPLRIAAYRLRAIIAEQRALRRAARAMPERATWEWVAPRLMPLIAGPRIDRPGDPIVRVVSGIGPALVFGVDLGGVLPVVDRRVAERWERTSDEIHQAAMANLRARAARVAPAAVVEATMSGRIFRIVRRPKGAAASLILLPDEIERLFGPVPQLLAAPAPGALLSFPPQIPPWAAAEIAFEFEAREPFPLMLDPFVYEHGTVRWQQDEDPEDPDQRWS